MTTVGDDDVWVGVDLGTQSVRVLAVTADGTLAGSCVRQLASRRDGVRHEQDPEEWWIAVKGACVAALAAVDPARVRGVAVDGTSGTIVLTDARGDVLSPAIMYDDQRAAAYVERINDAGGELFGRLGYRRMQASWALPKILWLLENGMAGHGSVRVQHQTDFIAGRLVGHGVATDLSSALKSGADLISETWPADLFETLGVPHGFLPDLVRSGTPLGTVSVASAAATGLPAGTPVYAGATDGCAAQLGAGALSPGDWNSVLGTTLVLKGVTATLLDDPTGAVYSHRGPGGRWLPGGASNVGAGVLARDFAGRDLDALALLASERAFSSVVTYPLAREGERFPFVAEDARSFVLGAPADEAERYAAVLAGVAYVERLCFDYLDLLGAPITGRLVLTGGATKSDYWNQLRADVLGRPVTLVRNAEPALGMALLSAAASQDAWDSGDINDIARRMVHVSRTIDPRPDTFAHHDSNYRQLVVELARRGWLPAAAADHALERTPS